VPLPASLRGALTLERGIALYPFRGTHCERGFWGMGMDPNTHAFVLATAAITSIAFAISFMNVLAVVLSHLLQ
jgi:hypothetical protein